MSKHHQTIVPVRHLYVSYSIKILTCKRDKYCKKTLKACSKCRLAMSLMKPTIEPEIGNIPGFRIPRSLNEIDNQSYQYCFFDFKGPILVNDDRKFKTKGRSLSNIRMPSAAIARTRLVKIEVMSRQN